MAVVLDLHEGPRRNGGPPSFSASQGEDHGGAGRYIRYTMPTSDPIDISQWELREDEPQGKNEKSWYRDPRTGHVWLFKPAARRPGQPPDGREWAEKIAELLAVELDVPVAPVEFAVLDGVLGTICENANPGSNPIQSGSALLTSRNPSFDPRAKDSAGHSAREIQNALRGIEPPLSFSGPRALTSYDVFCGYLVLDALIANQDRHSQNWSVVSVDGRRHLMESYDHGSSLSAGHKDTKRQVMTDSESAFQGFLQRGRATRFESGRHTTLREYARMALDLGTPGALEYWLDKVDALTPDIIAGVVSRTHGMTGVASTFVVKLLVAEREGLIDALS